MYFTKLTVKQVSWRQKRTMELW